MDFKKGLIILSLLLILCVSLGAVSATDNIDINDGNQEDLVVSTVNVDGNNNDNGGDSAITNLKEGEKTFADLNATINSGKSEVSLEYDYTFTLSKDGDFANGIIIDKPVTIDGKGHRIDISKISMVIFHVKADNVIIKNIEFINGAGDICWNGSDGVLSDCNFIRFSAGWAAINGGGAIFWNGARGNVSGCNFIESNTTYGNGGAIFWNGSDGVVSGCTFNNSNTRGNGGAIFWNGVNGVVSGCTFNNSNASTYGGTIYWNSTKGTIRNCNFFNSLISKNMTGGFIYWDSSDGVVSGSSFNNAKKDFEGGSIYWNGSNGNVNNCIFISSNASRGGSIFWNGVKGKVSGCNFTNSYALLGGAIFWNGVNGVVSSCNFNKFHSNEGNGSAIFWNGSDGVVSGCTFNNSNASRGGAIFWNGSDGVVSGCTFNNSNASYSNGIASYKNGGAIYWNGVNGSVINCTFINSTAQDFGGAISWCAIGGKVSNCTFINSSSTRGGAIHWDYDSINGSVNGCIFINSFLFPNYSGGGAIYWSASKGIVKNCTFINSTDEAISWYASNGVVSSCSFSNSKYGHISWSGDNGSVSNCTFINSTAIVGGAIYISTDSSLNINNCTYIPYINNDKAPIVNEGTITSKIIITVLDNSTFSLVDGKAILNATIITSNMSVIGQDLVFIINGENVKANSYDDGLYIAEYAGIITENQIVSAFYDGATNIEIKTGRIFVHKDDPIVNITVPKTVYYGGTATIIVSVPSGATGNVTLTVANKTYTCSIKRGLATFNIKSLNVGTHNIKISYEGDDNYNNASKSTTLKVNKATVTITPTALNTTYDSGKYFQVKVLDANKKAVSGLKLTLKIYTGSKVTSTVTVTTNASGIAKYSASKLSIATHKVIVSLSNTYYTASSKTSSIKVSKAPTTVTAPVVKYKKGANKYFKVTVKNKATGKVVKSLAIKIKVYTGKKYKTYTVKTNTKGIAQLSTRYLKKGTHKVVISSGNSKYTVSKSGKLIVIK